MSMGFRGRILVVATGSLWAGSVAACLGELHENAAGRLRVDEGHLVSASPRAWGRPDELESFLAKASDLRLDVVDAQAHVVDSLASLLEKLGDRRARIRGLQQLETTLSHAKERDSDRLGRHLLASLARCSEEKGELLL